MIKEFMLVFIFNFFLTTILILITFCFFLPLVCLFVCFFIIINSLDTDLLIQHIRELKAGKTVNVPQYDFSTHLRKVGQEKEVLPKPIILVEGILIFSNPQLVNELDIKVYVDADSDVRLIRRIKRDVRERGRTADDVMVQYSQTVRPMHNEFVEPSKNAADIIVQSHHGGNPDIALNMIVNHLKCEAGLDGLSDNNS